MLQLFYKSNGYIIFIKRFRKQLCVCHCPFLQNPITLLFANFRVGLQKHVITAPLYLTAVRANYDQTLNKKQERDNILEMCQFEFDE